MKSRKEIARLANELTQALEQSTDDKVFLKIVAYGKDALDKRQIAPPGHYGKNGNCVL